MPTKKLASAIRTALQIVPDYLAIEFPDAIVHLDLLDMGPCDKQPVRHLSKRREFWSSFEPGDFESPIKNVGSSQKLRQLRVKRSAGVEVGSLCMEVNRHPQSLPITIWSSPTWCDRLFLWWTLSSLLQCNVDIGRLWLADSTISKPLKWHSTKELAEVIDGANQISAKKARVGARLWRIFADTNPKSFDDARQSNCGEFPCLGVVAERYGDWFPRVSGASKELRLSFVDQCILESLRVDRWRTPVEIVEAANGSLRILIEVYGEKLLLMRLRDWIGHSPNVPRVIMRNKHARHGCDNAHTSVEYRITEEGCRLKKEGLNGFNDGPPCWIGGCRLYSNRNRWIRRVVREKWSIESI